MIISPAPITEADADGKPWDGDPKYVMHFDKGHLPPAPKDRFILMLKLYWPVEPPKPSIIDGVWKPPAVKRVK